LTVGAAEALAGLRRRSRRSIIEGKRRTSSADKPEDSVLLELSERREKKN